MEFSNNNRVNQFMNDLLFASPEKLEIIELVRKIFCNSNNKLIEDIKYGGLVFNLSNTLIGGIFPYKNHISIEFSNGADFSDPLGLLEGKGKRRRHLKIIEKQDIDTKSVSAFVAESVKQI